MSQSKYHLFSKLPGAPNLGIWYLSAKSGSPTGQPVRLAADLVEWVARPEIAGGGPTRLGVGPYKYTREYRDEAFATNDEEHSRDWFLVPSYSEQYYLIAADPKGERVWTAGEKYDVIKIKPFTGEDNQLFRFAPRIGD